MCSGAAKAVTLFVSTWCIWAERGTSAGVEVPYFTPYPNPLSGAVPPEQFLCVFGSLGPLRSGQASEISSGAF